MPDTPPRDAKIAGASFIDELTARATEHLVQLIRVDTSNPPGNEQAAAAYIEEELRKSGVSARIIERNPNRANLIARLIGSGSREPFLLLSHLDVVPADPAGWRFPPFSGTVSDGYVWGRGAVDMKHIVATMLTAVQALARLAAPLSRDLIFAATEDEESAGESGAGWLFREHRELVACGMAVTEGARSLSVDGQQIYALDVAQRGWVTVDLTRRSMPGHSSLPVRPSCLHAIGEVLAALARGRFPHRVTPPVRDFIAGLAALVDERQAQLLSALLDEGTFQQALADVPLDPQEKLVLEAMLHSQATPTLMNGGESTRALPQKAQLRLAGRVLPGESREEWIASLETLIGPLGEHELSEFDAGVGGTRPSALFESARRIIREQEPGCHVLPGMSIAGGDIQHALASGADAVGCFLLADEPGAPSPMSLAHGVDERISIRNLRRCVEFLWKLLLIEAVEPEWSPTPTGSLG